MRYDKAKKTTTEPLVLKVRTIYQQQTALSFGSSQGLRQKCSSNRDEMNEITIECIFCKM